jgi:hypothetical protein
MTELAYPYHEFDAGSHKRQRIGEPDQQLWVENGGLTTELSANRAFDPVRDLLQGDGSFTDQEFFNFQTNQINDNSSWFPDISAESFQPSYPFDANPLLPNPLFDEQNTAPFDASFQENHADAHQDLAEDAIETNGHELAQSMEVEPSPEPVPSGICFGMVCMAYQNYRYFL